jgi:hypothetical protein
MLLSVLNRFLILSFQQPAGISHDCVVSEPLLPLLLDTLPSMS